jgi:hypothetical protein
MARIRTVKPEFWGDPKTARVSRDARLLFLGLLNESDDEGRQLGSPRKILGVVFPNDEDVSTDDIHRWLGELETVELVHRYRVDDIAYLLIHGFCTHQKVQHPSKSRLPAPPLMRSAGDPHDALAPDLGSGSVGIDLGSESVPPPWRDSGEKPIDFIQARKAKEAGA